MRELNEKRNDINTLRALPLVVTLIWVVYLTLYAFYGVVIPIEVPVVTLGFYVIYRFSRRFSCVVNRLMIEYAYVCTCCLWHDRYHGFGQYLQLVLMIAIVSGMALLVLFVMLKCNVKEVEQ